MVWGNASAVGGPDGETPDLNGVGCADRIGGDAHRRARPISALSSRVSPAGIERGGKAGSQNYVAKFDRPGLIAARKEQTAGLNRAA